MWQWGCTQLEYNMTNPVREVCTEQGKPCNRVRCSVGSQRNVSDKQKGHVSKLEVANKGGKVRVHLLRDIRDRQKGWRVFPSPRLSR